MSHTRLLPTPSDEDELSFNKTPLASHRRYLSAEQEKRVILKNYRTLTRLLEPAMKNEADKKLFKAAFKMAAEAHKTMRRKSGDPYILHPIAVARILIEEMGMGLTCAIVALLHDTVEDTEITSADIERKFGHEIAEFVAVLTKMRASERTNVSIQAENVKKILFSLVRDPKIIFVKLADRLHNMRTLREMKEEKRVKIASETMQIYVPIAHRLGLYKIKTELEDISMMYLHSSAYNEIVARLQETKKERTRMINHFIRRMDSIVRGEYPNLNFEISGRTKSIYSIWMKMQRKKIPLSEVFDLFAIRLIIDVPEEDEKRICWELFFLISRQFYTLKDRIRDWITQPKSNGYSALHTTVLDKDGKWFEVQIRSRRADGIAETGLAAHFKYKENNSEPSEYDQWILKIRKLLEGKDNFDSAHALQDFRHSLIVDQIFVFTPNGEIKQLPANATVLDFAYEVHTQLGEQCIGAKVNNMAVTIDTRLHSGDRIELITSAKQHPDEAHLHFLVLPKARKAVARYVNQKRRLLAIRGMKIFSNHLHEHGIIRRKNYKQKLMKIFSCPHINDFFARLATGEIDIALITPDFFTRHYTHKKETDTLSQLFENLDAASTTGSSTLSYAVSMCCQPMAGDKICGVINTNIDPSLVQVHSVGCKNAMNILALYDCKVINLKWHKKKNILFGVKLCIQGMDRKGVIYEVVKLISHEMNLNIATFHVDNEREQVSSKAVKTFELQMKLFIRGRDEWQYLVQSLRKIEGIVSVEGMQEEGSFTGNDIEDTSGFSV